jgi:hypothetical protein
MVEEAEIQKVANHSHLEFCPKCCGTPSFEATKNGMPLQEHRMTKFQKVTLAVWIMFPFMVAAAIGLVLWITSG